MSGFKKTLKDGTVVFKAPHTPGSMAVLPNGVLLHKPYDNTPSILDRVQQKEPKSTKAASATEPTGILIPPTNLSDDEIMADIKLMKGANLLQIAGRHTNDEILAKINANRPHEMTLSALRKRVVRALTEVAEKGGNDRSDVSMELERVRVRNGVKARVGGNLLCRGPDGSQDKADDGADEAEGDEDENPDADLDAMATSARPESLIVRLKLPGAPFPTEAPFPADYVPGWRAINMEVDE